MNLLKLLFLTTIFLFGYIDSDIDGVEDGDDLCPNTPFDKIVDENGCDEENRYLGSLTLQVSNSWQIDANNTFSNYGFSAYYSYSNFSFSLSNSQQSSFDNMNNQSNYRGDLYIDVGYGFKTDKSKTKFTIGSKIATGDESISTGENDYYGSILFNYITNYNLSLFSNLSYTLMGDSPNTDYQNSFSYSFGVNYIITPNWYSSILYSFSDSIYRDSVDSQSISWYNSYQINQDYFVALNYNYGVDELSFDHAIKLYLGVTFE